MKKKLTILLIAIFLILGDVFSIGAFAKENGDTPRDMANRIEAAICGQILPSKRFTSYGEQNHINLGICNDCGRKYIK